MFSPVKARFFFRENVRIRYLLPLSLDRCLLHRSVFSGRALHSPSSFNQLRSRQKGRPRSASFSIEAFFLVAWLPAPPFLTRKVPTKCHIKRNLGEGADREGKAPLQVSQRTRKTGRASFPTSAKEGKNAAPSSPRHLASMPQRTDSYSKILGTGGPRSQSAPR